MFYIKISPVTFLKARASVFCTIMITSLVWFSLIIDNEY
jgi:hypothetical protein